MAIKINGVTVIADSQAITTTSTVSATGNITGGNLSVIGTVTAAGINTGSSPISTTGNVIGGNILTNGQVSALGNITAANFNTTGSNVSTGNVNATGIVTATGNITGGNILTAGGISATGFIQGGNLTVGNAIVTGNLTVQGTETIFNVANLTVNDKDIIVANNVTGGANVDGSGIQAGNPGVATWFFNNATTSWQSNIAITPTTNGTLSLGGASNYWGTAFVTTASVTGNVQGGNLRTAGLISATGTITGSTFSGAGTNLTGTAASLTVGTATVAGTVTTAAQPNITSVGTLTSVTTSGALTVNSGGAATAIVNGSTDGIGNIGASGNGFNTVFAKATSAQYADLAENYSADAEYASGTVLVFGGTAEVTVDAVDSDRRVAGVVSTNPAYIMNDRLDSEHVATVALTGRVPCFVTGPVRKGDLMVTAGLGRARAEADPRVGTVIGKALENFDGAEGTIEVVVGRF